MLPGGERWQALDRRLTEALALAEDEREAWLDRLAADEPDIGAELRRLLTAAPADDVTLDELSQSPLFAEALGELPGVGLGSELGGWRLLRRLGIGGMSEVFLAEREQAGVRRRAALKLMAAGLAGAQMRARFVQEARILARLSDPRIARLYDAGLADDGRRWLAMELVDGEPIDAYCARHALDLRARLRLFVEVLTALGHAHRHLIVHRDLKPSNVLVTADGAVKLLDFGIAKALDGDDGEIDATRTDLRLLTPAYASPEQIRGEPVTTASDIYQAGLLLYRLLTGNAPFDQRPQALAELHALSTRPVPPPSARPAPPGTSARGDRARRRGLRGDLDTITLHALQIEPVRRYASCAAFAEDIERHLDGRAILARRDRGYRAARYLRRHWLAVAAGAAMVLLLIGYAATVTWQSTRLEAERNAADAARRHAEATQGFLLQLFGRADPADSENRGRSVDELLDEGVRRAEADFADQPLVAARVLLDLGDVLHRRARLPEAQAAFERSLALRRAALGAGHPDTLVSLERFGQVANDRGDLAAAHDAHRAVLDGRERLFGPDSPEVGEALILLARDETALGQPAKAEALLRRALAISEAMTDGHADHWEILSDLGLVLYNQQRYQDAEPLFARSLAAVEKHRGAAHPFTLTVRRNHAAALRQLGRHEEAYAEFKTVQAGENEVFDRPHDKQAITSAHLGRTASALGRPEEAVGHWRQSVEIALAALGPEHPMLANFRLGHAEALLVAGRRGDAEPLLEALAANADAKIAEKAAQLLAQ